MRKNKRRIRVEPQRRPKPDYRKISAAFQSYLAAQAEADAEAQNQAQARQRRAKRSRGVKS